MCETTNAYINVGCSYCGYIHNGTCPRIEEIEYYPDGIVKKVKFKQETPIQIEPNECPNIVTVTYPYETGRICGVDCPQTTW